MDGGLSERSRRIAEFFDVEATRYDSAYDAPGAGRVVQARLAAVLRLLGDEPGEVLDAGMGGARLCVELDRCGWTVSGIDSSAQMVALARERLPHASGRLRQAPIETLPFSEASFDAVVATGVLEYVDDLVAALRELARVLRPGGRAVVSYPNLASLPVRWRGGLYAPAVHLAKRLLRFGRPMPFRRTHSLSGTAFEAALASVGLPVESVETVGTRLLPRPLARRVEGPPSLLGALFGLQLVFSARKG